MYTSWKTQIRIAQLLKWYFLEDIQELITVLLKHIHEGTIDQLSPRELKMLKGQTPVTQHTRFPENQEVVSCYVGDWGLHINRVLYGISLLIYSDRKDLYTCMSDTSTITSKMLDNIEALQQLLISKPHVLTRETFESHYELEWIDD